jgi:hypothetical protein
VVRSLFVLCETRPPLYRSHRIITYSIFEGFQLLAPGTFETELWVKHERGTI